MNVIKRIYYRTFQAALKVALPVLPYRDPEILNDIASIPAMLKSKSKVKPLIVTDKTIRKLGLTNKLENALKGSVIDYEIYDGVVANPTTQNVAEALKMYKDGKCDCLIAIGGGSPMDCAKGVGALVARPKKTLNDLGGILKVRKAIPFMIAIPTTAGTGSETTLACVIVDSFTRHKYAINDFPLIPKCAVLDEEVTLSLPKNVVSTTGMDALTHAIEAYIGRGGNSSTRRDALEAIKLVFENIVSSYNSADRIARKNMLIASHKAGRAFSKAYVGYVHALAHSLGGKYNTPHGLANAVILPIVLRQYGRVINKKLYKIAEYCGFVKEGQSVDEVVEGLICKIEQLNKIMQIPEHLYICQSDIDMMADYAYREANPLYPVPVLWDRNKLKELYNIIGDLNVADGNSADSSQSEGLLCGGQNA